MLVLLRLQRRQKQFLTFVSNSHISFSFLLIWNWNDKYVHTLPLFPWKPYPIPDQNGWSAHPFSDQNGAKTLPSRAALDCSQSPIFPWDRRDIASLTINGGHLDFQNVPRGRASGSSLDTHASVTQSALSRRSYEKIGDCEQSTVGRHIPLLII